MSELILHIGIPETGDLELQTFFKSNRERFQNYGWVYPELTGKQSHLGLERSGFWLMKYRQGPAGQRQLNPSLIDADGNVSKIKKALSEYPHVILSNSGLSTKPYQRAIDLIDNPVETYWRVISTVLERLDFEQLRIIIYLKRQDEWLAYKWKHDIELGYENNDFHNYLSDSRWIQFLRFNELIEGIERGLNVPYELIVRVYDRNQFKSGSVYSDFCDAVGIPWDPGYDIPEKDSSSLICLDLAEALRSIDKYARRNKYFRDSHLMPLVRSLTQQYPGMPGCTPFSANESKELFRYFDEDNTKIAKRFFSRDKLFLSDSNENRITWVPNHKRIDEFNRLFQEECRKYLKSEENRIEIRLAGYKVCLIHPSFEMMRTYSDYMDDSDAHIDFSVDMSSVAGNEAETDPNLPLLHELFRRQVVLFHSSSFSYQGKAYLLVAESGGGKSTLARLFRERFPNETRIINDDLPLLRFDSESIYVCGSPWRGKHKIGENISAPLHGIFIISKGSENRMHETSPEEMYQSFFSAIRYKTSDSCTGEDLLSMLNRLCHEIPVYHFSFVNSEEAADELLKAIIPHCS